MTQVGVMMRRAREATTVHPRLIKCTLAVDESRAWWEREPPADGRTIPDVAFADFWFGEKSFARVRELAAILRARFDAFPDALAALRSWRDMRPETRALICHWHVQLTDPLYRRFTADFLPGRRGASQPEVRRPRVIAWVAAVGPDHWTTATRTELASRLLSTAHAAGLVCGRRDPRGLTYPRVPDDALAYVLQLLRDVTIEGTLLENPYLRSVGLEGPELETRLRGLACVRYRRMGDAIEWGWRHDTLIAWVAHELGAGEEEAT